MAAVYAMHAHRRGHDAVGSVCAALNIRVPGPLHKRLRGEPAGRFSGLQSRGQYPSETG